MYEILFLIIFILDIYLIKENKSIEIKSYIPAKIKIILALGFLVFIIITRKYANNKIALSYPLLLFVLLFNSQIGGIKKDCFLVFWSNNLLMRKKILFKDIRKVSYKNKDSYNIFSVYAYSSYYNIYFSKEDSNRVLKILEKNKIIIEKRK